MHEGGPSSTRHGQAGVRSTRAQEGVARRFHSQTMQAAQFRPRSTSSSWGAQVYPHESRESRKPCGHVELGSRVTRTQDG
jgi:hypothetical protein